MREQALSNIVQALASGGYSYVRRATIGRRPNGNRHVLDILAKDNNSNVFLISLRCQQKSGTTEQKVPYEIVCLAEAMQKDPGRKAYLVLGGSGWTLRDYYLRGGLNSHLVHANLVTLKGLQDFVTLAQQGNL